MARGGLVAGVDSSTQATKVLVIEPDSGEVLASARAAHTVEGDGGARETEPRAWWAALHQALAATRLAGQVGAISIAGQQHGLVALDEWGQPLRSAILWNDTRAAPDAADLVAGMGPEYWATRTGLVPNASFTVAKWAWLRRVEPAVAEAAAAVRLPHDYLTERLTGSAVTDRGDASGTGWWSPGDNAYALDVLALTRMRLDPSRLPVLLAPTEPAGEVARGAAETLGLAPGTVVGPGTGDNAAAALGLGLAVGEAVLSLGTSGTAFAVSETPAADPSGIVAGFADASGRFLPLACTLNCTQAVDRMAGLLDLDRDDVRPAGSVVVLPYFDGERTPHLPGAAGLVAGLRRATAPQQILMATYEGAIASLLTALDAVGSAAGGLAASAPLIVIGGGARGRTWIDVVGRLSGRPVHVPEAVELVALGAAVQAASILRGEPFDSVAHRWRTRRGETYEAVDADHERLARIEATQQAVATAQPLADLPW